MGSAFNPLILSEKLSKLNSSQQSIETLSHWCIFHMHKAKQVVETWDRQFHCSPREQRLAFLYLANDILQNSRRKGAEFVEEFWKVLPESLRDVIENSDEFGKKAALRLINIWEERKVFGSRGLVLKEEFLKRRMENGNPNPKPAGFKLRPHGGNTLDKLVSGYQAVYGGQLDEDAIFNKCNTAITLVEKVDKDVEGDYSFGHINGSNKDELKEQDAILRGCVEQLTAVETSRANLLSLLREAVQEQEYKLDQVRKQIQTAQTLSEKAGQLSGSKDNGQIHENGNFTPGTVEPTTSVTYTRQVSCPEKSVSIEQDTKSAAADVAAKLAASASSAQMLTYVLSSLASEGVIGNNNNNNNPDDNYPPEKKPKIENQPPPPSSPPPPLPPLPPPMQPPYQVPEYMPGPMAVPAGPYGYLPPPHHLPSYASVVSTFAPPSNGAAYQSYTATEGGGGFYGQPPSFPMGGPTGHQ